MTSDAKIGLLLGLVFIFIIAFVINGLPRFFDSSDSNELTTNLTAQPNYTPGIADSTRQAAHALYRQRSPAITIQPPARNVFEDSAVVPPPGAEARAAVIEIPAVIAKKVEKPKLYTVKDGDSLSLIAQKSYGNGNVQTGMKIIGKASKLESYDDIYVGQKLVIPAINPPENVTERIVEVIKPTTSQSHTVYVVVEGDSLWGIAAEKLGDGARHSEISELNILSDAGFIKAGMKLKIPTK